MARLANVNLESIGDEGSVDRRPKPVHGVERRPETIEVPRRAINHLVSDKRTSSGQREIGSLRKREHQRGHAAAI